MLSNINSLNGFLQVFTPESFQQFWSYAPYITNYCTDLSPYVQAGGTAVNSRIATSNWTANNTATNGLTPNSGSTNEITIPLVERDVTVGFTELQWATMIPEVLLNTFAGPAGLALANTVVVDLLSSLSGSAAQQFINSGSFGYASASYCANLLSKVFAPMTDRCLIMSPDYFYQMNQTLSPTYIYGQSTAIQEYESIRVAGFNAYQYGGIKDAPYNVATSATLNSLGTGAIWQLVNAIATHKSALAIASRSPLEVNNGLVTAVNHTDPTSGLTMQSRITNIQQTCQWYVSDILIYGCQPSNPTGSVLVIKGN